MVPSSLPYLNNIHQTYDTWITYSSKKLRDGFEIYSFYRRLFDLIELNDFTNKNRQLFFNKPEDGFMALSML